MLLLPYNEEIVQGCHFDWWEYARLQEWNALAIPTDKERASAITLFTHIRDYIRVPLNKALTISSGCRTKEYTQYLRRKGIPAALASAHNEWKAVDLLPPAGMSNAQFWHWCSARWPGRMENLSATPGWVHLDTREWGSRRRFNP